MYVSGWSSTEVFQTCFGEGQSQLLPVVHDQITSWVTIVGLRIHSWIWIISLIFYGKKIIFKILKLKVHGDWLVIRSTELSKKIDLRQQSVMLQLSTSISTCLIFQTKLDLNAINGWSNVLLFDARSILVMSTP